MVSKLIHLLDHQDTDMHFAMLEVARNHLNGGRIQRTESPFTALVFASLKLAKRIVQEAVVSAAKTPKASEETRTNETLSQNVDSVVVEGDQGAEGDEKNANGEEPAADIASLNADGATVEKKVT